VYIPSMMLMALHEDRLRDLERRALNVARRSRQPGRARSPRIRSWAIRSRTALRARCASGAASAGAAAAGVRP
jgi:hypothetical protein